MTTDKLAEESLTWAKLAPGVRGRIDEHSEGIAIALALRQYCYQEGFPGSRKRPIQPRARCARVHPRLPNACKRIIGRCACGILCAAPAAGERASLAEVVSIARTPNGPCCALARGALRQAKRLAHKGDERFFTNWIR